MATEMDSVEKFFKALADPEGSDQAANRAAAFQLSTAMEVFLKDPPSEDPDYQYLLNNAQKGMKKPITAAAYFRQQLAQLAVQKTVQRKDKSFKARQMKYHKWLAYGMKNETWPFPNGKPQGAPSTARIAGLANPTSCAACHKAGANLRCPGCNFQDDAHVVEKTAYCNKKCLKDHYDTHKSICEGRVMVYRAALLLEYIFMAIQEATYVYPLGKVYEKNGIIYLIDDSWDRAGMTGRTIFFPFPKHLVESREMHHALLLWGQCKELSLSLYPLIKYLFRPMCKSMDLVFTQPKNVIRPICQVSSGRALNLCLHRHIALKLTLTSDEQYVIDLTSAQFGWKETLAPWETWMDLRVSKWQSEIFKPATGELRAFIQQNNLESYQQDVRGNILRSVMQELNVALRTAPDRLSFDKVLKSDIDVWKKVEYEVMQMVRQRIYLLVTSEYHKSYYRLWLGPGPPFGAQLAKEQAGALKQVWMSGKEFDRLKNSGADMKKIWSDRMEKMYKPEATKDGA
ncbi:hypothetical protein F4859DRAFT_369179 [Xylaria cf. heliscus]|nr:hypothetical protein F4859DRAFT_369179 [Xylaria cf. heliscus]